MDCRPSVQACALPSFYAGHRPRALRKGPLTSKLARASSERGSKEEDRKGNNVGRGSSHCINYRRGDTLAQKSRKSPLLQSRNKKGEWGPGGLQEAPGFRKRITLVVWPRALRKRPPIDSHLLPGELPVSCRFLHSL
eukprot:scaffold5518_cov19-Tisochrysis_lutea.AAC.1